MDRRVFLGTIAGSAAVAAGGTYLAEEARIAEDSRSGHVIGAQRPPGLTTTSVIWRATTDRNVAALTFDDGPDPRYTPGVLDALRKYHVTATFFMQGLHIENYPDLARAVAAEHAVGNHTYYHNNLSVATAQEAAEGLHRTHDVITRVTEKIPTVFRPPWGHISGAAAMIAASLGYDIIIWSDQINTEASARHNVDHLNRTIRPGSIVLAHDGGKLRNTTVIKTLPGLLRALKDRDVELVTVPRLLEIMREDAAAVKPNPSTPAEPLNELTQPVADAG